MTTPREPNATQWGLPPNLAAKWEGSTDLVQLIVWNLNTNKGMAFDTSQPFPNFIRLARIMVTNVNSGQLNEALGNLGRTGVCVLERLDYEVETRTMFMFCLGYSGDKDIPYSLPHEVDAKLAMTDMEKFDMVRINKPVELLDTPVSNEQPSGFLDFK